MRNYKIYHNKGLLLHIKFVKSEIYDDFNKKSHKKESLSEKICYICSQECVAACTSRRGAMLATQQIKFL